MPQVVVQRPIRRQARHSCIMTAAQRNAPLSCAWCAPLPSCAATAAAGSLMHLCLRLRETPEQGATVMLRPAAALLLSERPETAVDGRGEALRQALLLLPRFSAVACGSQAAANWLSAFMRPQRRRNSTRWGSHSPWCAHVIASRLISPQILLPRDGVRVTERQPRLRCGDGAA